MWSKLASKILPKPVTYPSPAWLDTQLLARRGIKEKSTGHVMKCCNSFTRIKGSQQNTLLWWSFYSFFFHLCLHISAGFYWAAYRTMFWQMHHALWLLSSITKTRRSRPSEISILWWAYFKTAFVLKTGTWSYWCWKLRVVPECMTFSAWCGNI